MSMERTEIRENIMKLLFDAEFYDAAEGDEQAEMYLDGLENLDADDREEMQKKFDEVRGNRVFIDAIINKYAKGWKTERMNKADLSILRLAIFEMLYDENVPVKVAINEAVELSKKYSSENGPAFINGILGKVAREEANA